MGRIFIFSFVSITLHLYTSTLRTSYLAYVQYMAGHPITEMLVSPQFQGSVKSKMLNEEEIERAVYFEKL